MKATMVYDLIRDIVQVTGIDNPLFRGTLSGGKELLDFRNKYSPTVTFTEIKNDGNVIIDYVTLSQKG